MIFNHLSFSYGPLAQVSVLPPRRYDNEPYGFVAFENSSDMEKVLDDIKDGRPIVADFALDKDKGLICERARSTPAPRRRKRWAPPPDRELPRWYDDRREYDDRNLERRDYRNGGYGRERYDDRKNWGGREREYGEESQYEEDRGFRRNERDERVVGDVGDGRNERSSRDYPFDDGHSDRDYNDRRGSQPYGKSKENGEDGHDTEINDGEVHDNKTDDRKEPQSTSVGDSDTNEEKSLQSDDKEATGEKVQQKIRESSD